MPQATQKRLDQKYQELNKLVDHFTGYPVNADFDYSQLYRFFELPLNNVGDADATSNYQLNTHEFEVEVIAFLAELYGSTQDYWGYITNGGSEGNLCGLHIARNRYPNAMVYHSEHAHYSVPKAINITRSEAVCLPVLENGEMDYTALAKSLQQHQDRPAIIMANLGTTMTGAVDNLHTIKELLKAHHIQDYYIHCDGALHGLILPFCEVKHPLTLNDFDSISISGHKFLGSPFPCGMFLTHKNIIQSQQQFIEYVQISDSTLVGSRNAITPLILWYAIHENGRENLKLRALACIETAEYAITTMQKMGINAWANPHSPIVVFPRPGEAVIKKWQLAPYQDIAHIVTVSHINHQHIDAIAADIIKDREGKPITPTEIPYTAMTPKTKAWLGITGALLGVAGITGLLIAD